MKSETKIFNNIADSRREEIADHYKKSKPEHMAGKLKFSSKVSDLKKEMKK